MFKISENIEIGGPKLLLMSGPCVVETPEICFVIAKFLKRLTGELGINYIFKASYDKANRTSASSFRGNGMEKNLEVLKNAFSK